MILVILCQLLMGQGGERGEGISIEQQTGKVRYPFSATPTIYDTLRFRSIITEKGFIIPPKDYTFLPGDIVVIRLSGDVPYEYSTVIDYSGKIPIYLPTGKTGFSVEIANIPYDSLLNYLNRIIEKRLRNYKVNVFLKLPSIFPVRFEGEVVNVMDIYVDGLTRLHDALKYISLKPNASRDRFLITIGDTGFLVDLRNLFEKGDLYSSPLLKPNMTIGVLSDSSFCTVMVEGFQNVNCSEGESVISVFRKATFMNPVYKPIGFAVKRRGFEFTNGDYAVKVGDTIFPIFGMDSVFVSGYVNKPTTVAYVPMATVAYYVSQAGGFRDNATIGKYLLISKDGKEKTVDDTYIPMPGDVIYVKKSFITLREFLFYTSSLVGMTAALLNTYLILRSI
ncbi:MAG: hypothetical protein ABIL29_02060 [candidate division WOR-3 bacterium]